MLKTNYKLILFLVLVCGMFFWNNVFAADNDNIDYNSGTKTSLGLSNYTVGTPLGTTLVNGGWFASAIVGNTSGSTQIIDVNSSVYNYLQGAEIGSKALYISRDFGKDYNVFAQLSNDVNSQISSPYVIVKTKIFVPSNMERFEMYIAGGASNATFIRFRSIDGTIQFHGNEAWRNFSPTVTYSTSNKWYDFEIHLIKTGGSSTYNKARYFVDNSELTLPEGYTGVSSQDYSSIGRFLIKPLDVQSQSRGSQLFVSENGVEFIAKSGPIADIANISQSGAVFTATSIITDSLFTTQPTENNASEYRWYISDTESGTYTPVNGALYSIYTASTSDRGKYLKVEATAKNSLGVKGTSVMSDPILVDFIDFSNVSSFDDFNNLVTNTAYRGTSIGFSSSLFDDYANLNNTERNSVYDYIFASNVNWNNTNNVIELIQKGISINKIKYATTIAEIKTYCDNFSEISVKADIIYTYILNNKTSVTSMATLLDIYNSAVTSFVNSIKNATSVEVTKQYLGYFTEYSNNNDYITQYIYNNRSAITSKTALDNLYNTAVAYVNIAKDTANIDYTMGTKTSLGLSNSTVGTALGTTLVNGGWSASAIVGNTSGSTQIVDVNSSEYNYLQGAEVGSKALYISRDFGKDYNVFAQLSNDVNSQISSPYVIVKTKIFVPSNMEIFEMYIGGGASNATFIRFRSINGTIQFHGNGAWTNFRPTVTYSTSNKWYDFEIHLIKTGGSSTYNKARYFVDNSELTLPEGYTGVSSQDYSSIGRLLIKPLDVQSQSRGSNFFVSESGVEFTAKNGPTVSASNINQSGSTLSVISNFTDDVLYTKMSANNTTEYQWHIANTSDGTYTPITGATGLSYTASASDITKFIKFEIRPKLLIDSNSSIISSSMLSDPLQVYILEYAVNTLKTITTKADLHEFIISPAISPVFDSSYLQKYNNFGLNSKNQLTVREQLILNKNSIDSADKLNQYFKQIIDTIEAEQSKNNTSTGGSSGGSGGRTTTNITFGGSFVTPPALPEKVEKELENVGWAKNAVATLMQAGIIAGDSEGNFRPNDTITREEFIKLVVVAFKLHDVNSQAKFGDVTSNDWHYSYVASAYNKGITRGLDNGNFGVGLSITREQMATMIYRASKIAGLTLTDVTQPVEFADGSDIGDYAKESVLAMQKAGIINGVGENKFAPKDIANRAQAAVMIYNIYSKLNN